MILLFFLFKFYGDHRDLHVLTHSFPTRRASDLLNMFTLIAIGTGAAWLFSMAAVLIPDAFPPSFRMADGSLPVYFEAAAVIVTLVLLRSEEHTSELQSLMRISYAVFCLNKKK